MMRRLYQAAADGCAELVTRIPALEPPFVSVGPRVWSAAGIGRFYRSTAHRVAQRMRAGGTPFRTLRVGGTTVILDATEFTTLELYFGGHVYETATTECLVSTLRPGSVFVDIGANHGYFSMLAAAIVGERGRVVSFEPNPSVNRQLRTHVALNGFDSRVEVCQAALSDAPAASAPLFVSQVESNSGLSSLTPSADTLASGGLSASHSIDVPVDTFDRWFAATALPRVDLVKVDVEGAEARVAAGMQTALAQGAIDRLIVETTWGSAAHAMICAAGFEPQPLDRVGRLSNILYVRGARR